MHWTSGIEVGIRLISFAFRLDRVSRSIDITDEIEGGGHDVRLAFQFGPDVHVELGVSSAVLSWPAAATPGSARLALPSGLQWSLHRGETDPILGWYSHGLGRRVPAFTLLGSGRAVPSQPITTRLVFLDLVEPPRAAVGGSRSSPCGRPMP